MGSKQEIRIHCASTARSCAEPRRVDSVAVAQCIGSKLKKGIHCASAARSCTEPRPVGSVAVAQSMGSKQEKKDSLRKRLAQLR